MRKRPCDIIMLAERIGESEETGMSRKSRRKQRERIRAEPSSVADAFASDGYVNRPAFLGAASELFSAGTFVRSGVTQDRDLLTTVYRENWLAKKIIDMPAEDMTRAWYTLAADISAAEINALRRLEAKHEEFREELRQRIALHHWNGRNESLRETLEKAFPGQEAYLIDNMNGTISGNVNFPCIAGMMTRMEE